MIQPGYGDMRASDAERERAVDVLKAAFAEGRLGQDEYTDRVGQVRVSRTYGDMAMLLGDLPIGPFGSLPPAARPDPAALSYPAARPDPPARPGPADPPAVPYRGYPPALAGSPSVAYPPHFPPYPPGGPYPPVPAYSSVYAPGYGPGCPLVVPGRPAPPETGKLGRNISIAITALAILTFIALAALAGLNGW